MSQTIEIVTADATTIAAAAIALACCATVPQVRSWAGTWQSDTGEDDDYTYSVLVSAAEAAAGRVPVEVRQ